MSKRYAVVYEETSTGFSAYVPDLPGCVATGRDLPEVENQIREAIEFHIEGMQRANEPIPEPSARVGEVEAAIA